MNKLLVIDVSNTNIVCGLFEGSSIVYTFSLTTGQERTADEFGVVILEMLRLHATGVSNIDGVVIASVVPKVMYALSRCCEQYLGRKPLVVGPGTKTGLKIVTENPREIGANRIVNSVAAFDKYKGPVLVIDFGTATTYDLVSSKGEFLAGITAPGMGIAARALWEETAKLPEIEIRKPSSILAQETVSSMQAGLVYGQIGQTEYIIEQVKKETGFRDLKVVATGELGRSICEEAVGVDTFDEHLTLDGLRIIYDKNTNRKSGIKE